MALLKCDTCGRTGEEVGHCGSFLTCPKVGVPIEPTDIVLSCDRCGLTRVVAAGRIMQGKALAATSDCPVADCEARAIFLTQVDAPEKPTTIEEPQAKKVTGRGKSSPQST